MSIITEEMRYRQRLCEYALKHGVTRAARKYQTNRQFVYRQLEKYDGSVRSLALKSRKPKSSPTAHTEEELSLIRRMRKKKWNLRPGRSLCQLPKARLSKKLREHVQTDTQKRLSQA